VGASCLPGKPATATERNNRSSLHVIDDYRIRFNAKSRLARGVNTLASGPGGAALTKKRNSEHRMKPDNAPFRSGANAY
jgi:hypothetical protein